MRPSRAILLALAILLLAAVAWLLRSQPPEPSYKGKTLGVWVDEAGMVSWNPKTGLPSYWTSGANSRETIAALGAMRTNAAPFLVKWIQGRPHPWMPHTRTLLTNLPPRLRKNSFVQDAFGDQRYRRIHAAAWSFRVLRADAACAAPALTQLMNDSSRPEIAERAMVALSYLGDAAVPPLMADITNRAYYNRAAAARCLWSSGIINRNYELTLVPVFIACLKDRDPEVARYAAFMLADLGHTRDDVMDALTDALSDPRANVRLAMISALGRFGHDGDARTAGLVEVAKDPDPEVRLAAVLALSKFGSDAVRALRQATHDPDQAVRMAAERSLTNYVAGIEPPTVRLQDGTIVQRPVRPGRNPQQSAPPPK